MGRTPDWGAVRRATVRMLGVAALGGAIGWGVWRGKHLSAMQAYIAAGVALGAVVGGFYALAGRRSLAWKKVSLSLPMVGSIDLEKREQQLFALDPSKRAAGWKIYTELVGRVATQPVADGTGTLRGALTSFHSLLQNVRKHLAEVPPQAPPTSLGKDIRTLETLTIYVMTEVRQLLATWHHQLVEHEGPPTPDKLPPPDSEFAGKAECEAAIAALQNRLLAYATAMAELLEVPRPDSFKLPGATAPASSAPVATSPPPLPAAT